MRFLDTDLLAVFYHDSNKQTGKEFLEIVDPEHVIISSGLDNKYTCENRHDAHPHDATVQNVAK